VIALGLAAAFAFGWTDYLSLDQLRERRNALQALVADHPVLSVAAFALLYALVVAFSIPGALILTLSGGFLFGVLVGGTATVLGATLGAVAVFIAARSAFGDVLKRRVGGAVAKFEEGVRKNAFSYVLTLRLLPIFPFWLVNIGLGVVNIPLRTYALATFLGVIPGTFIYSALGAGLGSIFDRDEAPNISSVLEPQIFLPLAGLALLALAPTVIGRLRGKKAAQEPSE
jgi:uncharacterized membrane protein YdjX (TVP38/TMEM64 family)